MAVETFKFTFCVLKGYLLKILAKSAQTLAAKNLFQFKVIQFIDEK